MELFNPQENNSSEKTAVTTLLQTQYTAECTHSPETNTYTLTLQGTPGCLPDFYTVVTTMPAAFIEGGKVKIGEVLFAMKHAAFKAGEVVAIRVSVPDKVTYFGSGKECCEGVASGAGAHNAVYRGKWLGISVTPEQYDAISSGTFEDLYIGDYWTIGDVNYRIAAFDYYYNCGGTDATNCTTHHAVIVPDTVLYDAAMNTTDTSTGGYAGSHMRTANLTQAKTIIKAVFSGHVIKHSELLVNLVISGKASGWAWFDSEVDLMNEVMVFGSIAWGQGKIGSGHNLCSGNGQLPLFALRHDITHNRRNWWLRDVCSTTAFAYVSYGGYSSYLYADRSIGVRPAFCIS